MLSGYVQEALTKAKFNIKMLDINLLVNRVS